MRVLGVDLGARRIGLAVSDSEGRLAFPSGFLESRGRARDVEALCRLIGEREIERVVVGLPIHMNGREGPEAEAARAFARVLGEVCGLPVDVLDERWTTREAERSLRESERRGVVRRRGRGTVDAVAAAILLRTYLARLDDSGPPGEPVSGS